MPADDVPDFAIERTRSQLARIGGPVFAPRHDLFSGWRIVGCGRSGSGGSTENAHVDIDAEESDAIWARTETTLGYEPWGNRRLAATLRSLFPSSSDGRALFEATIAERPVAVGVDDRRIEVDAVAADTVWAAEVTVGDRIARIVVQGVRPEDFVLHAISDPTSLPDSRFGPTPTR